MSTIDEVLLPVLSCEILGCGRSVFVSEESLGSVGGVSGMSPDDGRVEGEDWELKFDDEGEGE